MSVPPYAGAIVQEDGKCTQDYRDQLALSFTGESYARPKPPSISASGNQH